MIKIKCIYSHLIFATLALLVSYNQQDSKILASSNALLQSNHYGPPLWSPDGNHIAFSCGRPESGSDNLCIFDVQTSYVSRIEIEDSVSFRSGAAWEDNDVIWFVYKSPDNAIFSNSIGYYNIRSGEFKHFINLDDSFNTKHEGASGISINSSRQQLVVSLLLKAGDDSITGELYSISLLDKTITQLTNTTDISEEAPMWLSISNTLVYLAFDNVTLVSSIHLVVANGSETNLPVDVSTSPHRYTLSQDGRWALFVGRYQAPGLYLISTDGNSEPHMVSQDDFAYISWSPDGKQIAYTTVGVPGKNEFQVINAEELGLMELIK